MTKKINVKATKGFKIVLKRNDYEYHEDFTEVYIGYTKEEIFKKIAKTVIKKDFNPNSNLCGIYDFFVVEDGLILEFDDGDIIFKQERRCDNEYEIWEEFKNSKEYAEEIDNSLMIKEEKE